MERVLMQKNEFHFKDASLLIALADDRVGFCV